MKKKLLLITVLLIIFYWIINMFQFAKGIKEDIPKNLSQKKDLLFKYKNGTLVSFYNDFKKDIIGTTWVDEPPAVLKGVLFSIDGNSYYEIYLDSISEKYKFNVNMKWNLEDVGNSKIRSIKLIKK